MDASELLSPVRSEMQFWRGRNDAREGVLGRRWHQIVQPWAEQRSGVAVIGFACDSGVLRNSGRPGAQHGPSAIRTMLANLPVRKCDQIADAGDILCAHPEDMELAQESLAARIEEVLGHGAFPLAIGGGHEIAWATFSGLARHVARQGEKIARIGVINLDAHFDLRVDDRPSSGTPFRQIAENCRSRGWPFEYCCLGISEFSNSSALFRRATELRVSWRTDEELQQGLDAGATEMLASFIDRVDHLYLTVCLDVLPPWVAPGVSAPSACGVPLGVVEKVIEIVARSQKLRVADVAEYNPLKDVDSRTARVAARLIGRIVEAVSGR